MMNNEYAPGQCNIGPEEIRRRYRIGYTGLFLSGLFVTGLSFLHAPGWIKLLLFVPVFYSLSGFLQAWQKFCFVYGYLGVFSTEGRRKLKKVTATNHRSRDRIKAILLVIAIALGSGVVTTVYYFLS